MICVKDLTKQFILSRQQQRELAERLVKTNIPCQSNNDMSTKMIRKTFSYFNVPGFFKRPTVAAVAGLSFTCEPGRIFCLLGPNGAGKTTTLRIIATMLKPTSGTVTVSGYDVVKHPRQVRQHLGFLTGTTGLYDRLSASELVRYYANMYGMDKKLFEHRKKKIFALLGIDEFANRRIGKLSSGMRQKVSIARTIVHDPQIIVFDEPTAGLDVITARSIYQLIKNFRAAGKTVIFSTHIMGEVNLLSDDLAIIHKGKLCFCGSFHDFRLQMKNESLEDEFIRLVEDNG